MQLGNNQRKRHHVQTTSVFAPLFSSVLAELGLQSLRSGDVAEFGAHIGKHPKTFALWWDHGKEHVSVLNESTNGL